MANPTPPVPPMIVETAVSNDGEEVDLNPSGELPVPNGTTQPNPKPLQSVGAGARGKGAEWSTLPPPLA